MPHDDGCPELSGQGRCTCPPPQSMAKPKLYAPIQVPDWQVPILASQPFGRLRVVSRKELESEYA